MNNTGIDTQKYLFGLIAMLCCCNGGLIGFCGVAYSYYKLSGCVKVGDTNGAMHYAQLYKTWVWISIALTIFACCCGGGTYISIGDTDLRLW